VTKQEFREFVEKKIVVLDGATGSNLQKRGMPVGICPEQWIIENREIMKELQKEYLEAGTDILYAPTFGGNRIKLGEYELSDKLVEMNTELVILTKEAVVEAALDRPVYIAGNLTMTGEQLYPIGTMPFEELVDVYKEQVRVLADVGVDLFVVETMMSLQECRAAVLAIKETCDLPIMVTLTFNEDERTLYGTDAQTAMIVLQNLGADAVGLNCSTGPDKMHGMVANMRRVANVPIIVKPNAGLPVLVDGETVFNMEPDDFAREMEILLEQGVSIVGGCCGTTPEHIKRLAEQVKEKTPPVITEKKVCALTTERRTVEINMDDGNFMVVGERINPTGKKALQAELREGKLDIVTTFVEEQIELGADILDINVGMNGIDEKEMMLQVINHVTMISNIPLCIDSSKIDVLEAALRIYPGRALINSISLESEKFEKLIPIAKKYGAMFILLPLSDAGLPKDIDEKKEIIGKILDRAYSFGLTKEDIIVDGLVNTIGANKRASIETMETIRYCKHDLGVATICGLSNISFGLPERIFVNSTFLAFAIKEGLTMAIANPSQDLLMNVAAACDLLLDREQADVRYINRVTSRKMVITTEQATEQKSDSKEGENPVFEAVIKGNRKGIIEIVKDTIEKGSTPNSIIDTMLIPAINEVGVLFDKGIYFLPQLISSAEAMKTAIDYLEPLLERTDNGEEAVTIVMATVEGDIHDIGKNLVVLMLKNYGYRVIDLGKDVPSELIVETAIKENAKIIGLSALMTTTMMQMETVVNMVKEKHLDVKVLIGGAVITQSFADEIGADGYSKDAQDAVVVVKQLLENW
jgi:5-methyltetrahydrofolate--homocysteine methyltransferase